MNNSRWLAPFKVDGILYDQRRSALGLPYDFGQRAENYGATIPLMDVLEDEHDQEFDDCYFCNPIARGVVWRKVISGHVPCNG